MCGIVHLIQGVILPKGLWGGAFRNRALLSPKGSLVHLNGCLGWDILPKGGVVHFTQLFLTAGSSQAGAGVES